MTVFRWTAVMLIAGLLLGCGGSSGGHASSSKSSSSGQGKTYAPPQKRGGTQTGSTGGSGGSGVLPMPADTANGRASAASDEGTVEATKGQAVVTPGAPQARRKAGKR